MFNTNSAFLNSLRIYQDFVHGEYCVVPSTAQYKNNNGLWECSIFNRDGCYKHSSMARVGKHLGELVEYDDVCYSLRSAIQDFYSDEMTNSIFQIEHRNKFTNHPCETDFIECKNITSAKRIASIKRGRIGTTTLLIKDFDGALLAYKEAFCNWVNV